MLKRFEVASNRVKGLCFHPKFPWILATLHNGTFILSDWETCEQLLSFTGHNTGVPVRGIQFHSSLPLFVSGGDDEAIKVWGYKQTGAEVSAQCQFNLLGHHDYIRTVEFHRENPWILSASDDRTSRIWNWYSRTCIAVITIPFTHTQNFTMCASFHPRDDLVLTASLDSVVRVWDISGLRERLCTISDQNKLLKRDVVLKFEAKGHTRAVNWAAFHPTAPYIVSGSDDRTVRLWKYSDDRIWEAELLRGHFNNVSCTKFHPHREIIISCSEDRTLRFWDISKGTEILKIQRDDDRYWIHAFHPQNNLVAFGHDGGMEVFEMDNLSQLNSSTLEVKKPLFEMAERLDRKWSHRGSLPFYLLVDLLPNLKENSEISTTASLLIGLLIFSSQKDIENIQSAAVVEVTLNEMKEHILDVFLSRCACFALSGLAASSFNCAKVLDLGGLNTALSSMKVHLKDCDIQLQVISFLLQLSQHLVALKYEISTRGGYVLVLSMENHLDNTRVQLEGFSLLWSLASDGAAAAFLADLDIIEVVLASMKTHSNNSEMQYAGLAALSKFSFFVPEKVDQIGGVEVVLKSMQNHTSMADVQYQGCLVLTNFFSRGSNQVVLEKIVVLEGVEAVITAMKIHENLIEVQLKACESLRSFALGSENARDRIDNLDGTGAVLQLLQRYENAEAQTAGLNCLSALAQSELYCKKIVELEVLSTAVHAMKNYRQNANVQLAACNLIKGVATHYCVAPQILTSGVIAAVISSMLRNSSDSAIQEVSCAIFDVMATKDADLCEAIKSRGGIRAIRLAMQNHVQNEEVLGSARRAIESLQAGCVNQ
eukprot:TRINITY_DN4057_c0_g1_i1.p1 TRINITY_DN4057_c0_g1~~TRINITY_DN4057_c0_g1_i1.p1  ORF type:complete len:825 (+),score=125.09 TRINITY_DN4057_c0_g1_i1:215-2689(+)